MKKYLIIAALMFSAYFNLLFLVPANAAVEGKNPKLILDTLSSEEVKDLNVIVPNDTDIGFNVMTIQVYNDQGVQNERHVYFCKDLDGSIHWDNLCPDLDPIVTKDELKPATDVTRLPDYDPAQDSKKSAGVIASGVALLLLMANAGAKFAEAASATIISLSADKKLNGKPFNRWGDRSITWRFPGGRYTDKFFANASSRLSKRSLIFARVLGDGDYGRAMFGSLWTLLYLGAPIYGYWIAKDLDFVYSPPRIGFLLGLIALGVIDSFAGLLASLTYVVSILIINQPYQVNQVLLLLVISILGFGPVLIAAAARTFRRFTYNSNDRWEKLVDYALAPVIGMWSVMKIVEGLNGFIGKQFLVTFFSIPLGLFAGLVILIRMFWEEFANRVYTWRMDSVSTKYKDQTTLWKFIGFIVSATIATYFAYRFSAWSIYLAAAMALAYLPKLISIFVHHKLPKSRWVQFLTPKGIFLTLLLIFSTSTYQGYVRGYFDNSKTFLIWWVLLSAIPAFVIEFFLLFANSSMHPEWRKHPVLKYFWRLGAFGVYIALFIAIFQIDPKTVVHVLTQHDWHQIYRDSLTFFGAK